MPVVRAFALASLLACLGCSSTSKCDAAGCSGCCGPTGKCELGDEASACGRGGARCSACSAGLVCLAGGCAQGSGGGAAGGGSGGGSGGGGGGSGNDGGLDGGGGGDGGEADAGDEVTGIGFVTFVSDGAEDQQPVDFTSAGFTLTLGDGGVITSTGTASGTFRFANVPHERFMVHLGSGGPILITSARTLDLSFDLLGRASSLPAKINPTPLVFNLTGLTPWTTQGYVSLYSSNAGAVLEGFSRYATGLPSVGATEVNGLDLNYYLYSASSFYTPLIVGTQGDQAVLTQMSYSADGGIYDYQVRDAVTLPSFDVIDGTTTTVDAGLLPLALQTTQVSIDAGAFSGLLPASVSDAPYFSFQVTAYPRTPPRYAENSTALLCSSSMYQDVHSRPARLRQPFPFQLGPHRGGALPHRPVPPRERCQLHL